MEEGLAVVLCGQPNVGKSSLLNALLEEERAIVTDVPGTTRDVLSGRMEISGIPLTLLDTAGLRDTGDTVEKIGVTRARQAIRQADVALLLLDAGQPLDQESLDMLKKPPEGELVVALNKSDLPAVLSPQEVQALSPGTPVLSLSVKTGEGMEKLRGILEEKARVPSQMALTSRRHLEAARRAADSLLRAEEALGAGVPLDLCALDMRDALHALGEITGDQVEERLLDEVFSAFCVGK